MQRALWLCLPAFLACASHGRRSDGEPLPSRAALAAALGDTASATRVYRAADVAYPVTVAEPPSRGLLYAIDAVGARVHSTVAEPDEAYATIRAVIDTTGLLDDATLTAVPGSDPVLASYLIKELQRTRWRPARLADGRAVRQLVEQSSCRNCARIHGPTASK